MKPHFDAWLGIGLCVTVTATTSSAGAGCLVQGDRVSLEGITVQPRGEEAFTVAVEDVPVAVKVAPYAGAAVTIEVQGALHFAARRKNVWLTLSEDFVSPDGLVSMRRGSKLVHARLDGSAVMGAAVEYSNDVLPGEDKDAEELVFPIRVPCSMLTLDEPDEEALSAASESDEITAAPVGAVWWEPKSETSRLRLYARPSDGARFVDIVNQSCSDCFELVEVGRRGAWLEVQRYGEGVLVRGWLRRSALKQSPEGMGHGRGYGCTGDHGRGLGGSHSKRTLLYEGPATVQANTRVYATPGYGEWATLAQDLATRVRYYAGDTWAQMQHAPGVWSGIQGVWLRAYVPLSAIAVPPSNVQH